MRKTPKRRAKKNEKMGRLVFFDEEKLASRWSCSNFAANLDNYVRTEII
jgi:hypothetical protein